MPREYIKGDIVMYDNRIHTIIDTLGFNHYELSYISHPVHQLKLSGVSITPEILEKNGWEKVEYGPYGKGRIEIEQCNENEFMYCKGDLKVVFLYVHSLQHFLFGLGINHEMEV